MRHTISCVVRNATGVLARVVNGISQVNINIHSVAVSETDDVETSRMTLVVEGEEHTTERIHEHIGALPEVVELEELTAGHFISRQMMLVKVRAEGDILARVMQVAELTRATVLDVGNDTMTLELTGEEQQMNAMVRMLRPYGILELARSGRIAVRQSHE